MKYDYLIVGAGFSGAVLAERLANAGKKILIVDRRDHIGGNCYDYKDTNGITLHQYGPHIFHTKVKRVWDYMSRFTDWHHYFHRVLAVVEGRPVTVPFNLDSIRDLFPPSLSDRLERLLLDKFGYGEKIPILKLMEEYDKDLKFLADYIYKHVFLGYTVKQWDLKPEDLDFSVSARIPVYVSRDDRYFQDQYQGIPENGYTEVFKKIIDHENIELRLNQEFKDMGDEIQYDKLIFSGTVDSYFNYKLGKLPYRSLRFNFRTIDKEYFQAAAQVNYPNNYDFTRITEFKHFLNEKSEKTTIAEEYSQKFIEGENDPYYPIPSDETAEIYAKYQAEAEKLKGKVYFIGRLGRYKYLNMDQTIDEALDLFDEITGE